MLFPKRKIDIRSKRRGIAGRLSNFTKRNFVFDEIFCRSIEGVLQSMKFENINEQKIVCGLWGEQAKFAGELKTDWKNAQILYWRDRRYPREGEEYKTLLTRLYTEVYKQDKQFRKDIKKSTKFKLIHSMGNPNPCDTVLTENEFIELLEALQKL